MLVGCKCLFIWPLSCSSLDNLTADDLLINKGFFAGICLIILVVGLLVGGGVTMLLYRMQRSKQKASKYQTLIHSYTRCIYRKSVLQLSIRESYSQHVLAQQSFNSEPKKIFDEQDWTQFFCNWNSLKQLFCWAS